MKNSLPPGWRVRQPDERILAGDRIDFNPGAPLKKRFEISVTAFPWVSETVRQVDAAMQPSDKPVVFTRKPADAKTETQPVKPIKFSPKKLDALADDYFKKANDGRDDFSSKEWVEIQELSGLALRRWAAQLREELAAKRARDKGYAELVRLAAEWFDPAVWDVSEGPQVAEIHNALLADPERADPDASFREAGETVALYVLFYAAAKRSGDL
jgi:hypothetical protein